MKRRFFLASTVILGGFAISPAANAVVVVCANCSTFYDQLISYALQVQQKATQAATLQTNLNQYAAQIRAGVTLPKSIWTDAVNDMRQVRSIASEASLLTKGSGSILNRLQDAQGYANQANNVPANIAGQFLEWNRTLANAGVALGRVNAVQQQQEIQYASLQAQANVHSQNAVGQMQAIQASNEQLSIVATQLNQIQLTLNAAAQQRATQDHVANDRAAFEDAAMQKLMQPMVIPLTGYKEY